MKYHKQRNTTDGKYQPACQKRFSRINSQNYGIVSKETFNELMKTQPDICCKKCQKI